MCPGLTVLTQVGAVITLNPFRPTRRVAVVLERLRQLRDRDEMHFCVKFTAIFQIVHRELRILPPQIGESQNQDCNGRSKCSIHRFHSCKRATIGEAKCAADTQWQFPPDLHAGVSLWANRRACACFRARRSVAAHTPHPPRGASRAPHLRPLPSPSHPPPPLPPPPTPP